MYSYIFPQITERLSFFEIISVINFMMSSLSKICLCTGHSAWIHALLLKTSGRQRRLLTLLYAEADEAGFTNSLTRHTVLQQWRTLNARMACAIFRSASTQVAKVTDEFPSPAVDAGRRRNILFGVGLCLK